MATIACEPDVNRSPFILVFGFYLAWMLGIAVLARQRVKEIARVHTEITDYTAHYTGGKSYGSVVTFLTMFSTIFSGYTVLGVPQEGNDLGWFALRWVFIILPGMLAVVLFFPRLRRLAVARNYDSLGDLIVDRYNNKMVTLLMSGCWCSVQLCMVVSQMFQIYLFIPVVAGLDSAGQPMLEPKMTTAFIAFVIAICETTGGFDSVAVSDAAQSAVMLFSLVMVPITCQGIFGGAGGSVETKCGNTEVIDCTAGKNNSFGLEATCMPGCISAMGEGGSSFTNGCLEDINGMYVVHPPLGFSHWYHNMSVTPPAPYLGFLPTNGFLLDTIEYSNMPWVHYLGFATAILFGFAFNVPNTMRIFSAKTDTAVKRGGVMLIVSCYVATLPSVLLGIQIHANLKQVYQKPPDTLGASAYGILMTDFLRRGGWFAFLSVLGSISAIAASMSTIDSNLIGVGNCLTNDLINKILAPSFPKLGTPFAVSVLNKCVTISVMTSVTVAVLWTCSFNPTADYCPAVPTKTITEVNVAIINWAWTMGSISFMPMVLALFSKEPSPVSVAFNIVMVISLFAGLVIYIEDITYYGSNAAYRDITKGFGSAPIKTFYLSTAGTPLFVLPAGMIILCIMHKVIKGRGNFFKYDKSCFLKYSGGQSEEPLHHSEIQEIMVGTVEPCTTKIGLAATIAAAIIQTAVLPLYGEAHDGCNIISWGANKAAGKWGIMGCNGPSYIAGLPSYAFIALAGVVISNTLMLVAITRWKTCDNEGSLLEGFTVENTEGNGNKVGVEAVEMDEKPAAEETA